jgi:hypothetical protein
VGTGAAGPVAGSAGDHVLHLNLKPSHTWSVPTPPPVRKVGFEARPWGDGPASARELLPFVDNVSLVVMVSGYEHAAGYHVPGANAGLVLDHYRFGDLAAYLRGSRTTRTATR